MLYATAFYPLVFWAIFLLSLYAYYGRLLTFDLLLYVTTCKKTSDTLGMVAQNLLLSYVTYRDGPGNRPNDLRLERPNG